MSAAPSIKAEFHGVEIRPWGDAGPDVYVQGWYLPGEPSRWHYSPELYDPGEGSQFHPTHIDGVQIGGPYTLVYWSPPFGGYEGEWIGDDDACDIEVEAARILDDNG